MNEEYRSAIAALKSGSAPERVEQNVVGAFRRQKRSRVARRWGVGAVAAAGVLAAVGAFRLQQPNIIAPLAPVMAQAHIDAPALVAVTPLVETAPAPRMQRVQQVKRREEIVTPYYPLPSADSLPAPDAEAVVRMMVPGSTLQLVGFPVNEVLRPEFVRADVVVGQDGMARAIRFVQ
jgi:hypothetical protein